MYAAIFDDSYSPLRGQVYCSGYSVNRYYANPKLAISLASPAVLAFFRLQEEKAHFYCKLGRLG